MLNLSGPKPRVLLQLLIPLETWSVVNITAEVNDLCLISLNSNRVPREEVCLPRFEVLNDLLWGGYLRVVKCDCLVLSLGRRFTIYYLVVLHSFVGSVL